MDFQHTDDRRMLADTLDRFVREQYGFDTRQRIAASAAGADAAPLSLAASTAPPGSSMSPAS